MLKRIFLTLLMVLVAVVGAVAWLGYREDPGLPADPALASVDAAQRIEHGRYLASVGNCMGCHTVPGGKPYAGGRELATNFGSLYGPNLTPDADTGLGRWTADDFWRALHNGKGRDGRLLYPAFPYPSYRHVSRTDADALFAYLQSLPPVRQENRAHQLAFPYDQRFLLAGWRALYFRPLDGRPDAVAKPDSPQWLRGRYLVEGLAHCAECHTPRNRLGALRTDASLSGAMMGGQGWYAPPLTGDPVTGLGKWSPQEVFELLKTGVSARSSAVGPMAEAVHQGFQHVADADLRAMVDYLKSLPPAGTDAQAVGALPSAGLMDAGGKIYAQQCAQCHQDNGQGKAPAWPPLRDNISVVAASPLNTIRMVLSGGFAPATPGNPRPHGMPPFGHTLNDQDVAAVVSYVRNSWGNQAGGASALDVRAARESGR
ncbi:c-type cytochrome [Pigmentiphaga aceris]|uniref:C-type cytochrome n=1 Tax=Pigmentiphaga aceris TaxID=1940612 RepID=A0A5C0AT37_9BURK|nr:c-type cytochrome [Pigmentiphaga aceris]QEI05428.1 c-type cytochrome [Pigmentiphaga aceris]